MNWRLKEREAVLGAALLVFGFSAPLSPGRSSTGTAPSAHCCGGPSRPRGGSGGRRPPSRASP